MSQFACADCGTIPCECDMSDGARLSRCLKFNRQLREELERLKAEYKEQRQKLEDCDAEIGDFQNRVRGLVIELSGAPDSAIDGKGSDAGWDEFTLAEISQGFAYVSDNRIAKLTTALAAAKEALGLVEKTGWRWCGYDIQVKAEKALALIAECEKGSFK